MEYQPGETLVYPNQGVVEVTDIEQKDIAGHDQRFYVLKVLDSNRKIMVPVQNAEAVGLRPLIGEPEIEAIYSILRDHSARLFDNMIWHKRFKGYQDLLKTGSLSDVATVMRDLTLLKDHDGRQLSFGERRLLEQAQGAVVKEIALARSVSEDVVTAELVEAFTGATA